MVVLLLISVLILTVSAEKRTNIPKVLPIGTNVRGIVLNQIAAQTDVSNKDYDNFILFVQFQDINSIASETHYVEVSARTHLDTNELQDDIITGIQIESDQLGYILNEVYVIDYIKKKTK